MKIITTKHIILFIISFFITLSCNTGKLTIVADIPVILEETSAIEKTLNSDILWVIEDSGNKNNLYGLDFKGNIIKNISINNVTNTDWEDLTSDAKGNIYIGDFGNNSKDRDVFKILKVLNPEEQESFTNAEIISFELPEEMNSEDFESFFLYKNSFYIFSKDNKKSELIKVPNKIGNHVATYISEVKLKGGGNKVTSADISNDGKTVVLLNHNKLWKLSDYTADDFFNGKTIALEFKHNSQKEGITIIDSNTVLITDERSKKKGGNIYSFDLNKSTY